MYNFQQSVKVLQESLGGIRDIILGSHYDLFVQSYDLHNRKRHLNDAGILTKPLLRYLVEGFLIIIITLIALFYVILGNELIICCQL